MSDYHVLETTGNGTQVRVVLHIATPVGNSIAGVSFADAIVADSEIDKVSILTDISAGEASGLAAGTLVERVEIFLTHPDVPNATKQSRLDEFYTQQEMRVQSSITQRYWAWDFERDVP